VAAAGLVWVLAVVNVVAAGAAVAQHSDGWADRPLVPRTGMPAGVLGQRGPLRTVNPATAAPHLSYEGGPVVSNAAVYSVLWGSSGTYLPQIDESASPNMDSFFGQVGASSYTGWLGEYDTPAAPSGTGQTIGYASFAGRSEITPSTAADTATIYDDTIQAELISQVQAGHLPQPTLDAQGYPNTVYALFFPSGKDICLGDSSQCSSNYFCAYHNATYNTVGGVHLHYMVLPDDQSAATVSACGDTLANTPYTVMQTNAAHELAETITDPDVNLPTPPGWYDGTNGEIADICDPLAEPYGTVTGTDAVTYTVEKLWSNSAASCLIDKGSTTPGAAQSPTATPQAGGKIHISWAAPADDGGSAITEYRVYESTVSGTSGSQIATVTAPTVSWTSGSLTSGTRYYFEVLAHNVNGDGPLSGQVGATADATPPVVKATAPAKPFQLASKVTVQYAATDTDSPASIRYDVRYRAAAWNGGFGAYKPLATNTAALTTSLTGSPGHEYCVQVRAHDTANNTSPWTTPRCTAIPLDDRGLSAATSGWRRITSTAAYRGTLTRTSSTGAELRVSGAQAHRLALVVTTCATCGSIAIYLNHTLWHIVSTHASTTHYKLIMLPGTFSLRTTGITLKDVSGTSRHLLIDGLGIART
jgi:hypothetical protein